MEENLFFFNLGKMRTFLPAKTLCRGREESTKGLILSVLYSISNLILAWRLIQRRLSIGSDSEFLLILTNERVAFTEIVR